MVFDEKLAGRARKLMQEMPGYSERKMFGGVCFMLNGNMACGVTKDTFMLRCPKDQHAPLLRRQHTRPMDFTVGPRPVG